MGTVPQLPTKVKFMMELSFPMIRKLFPRKPFIGGRIGYAKEEIFKWLLIKKVMHWDYRSLEEVSGISHQTFIRRNQQFEQRRMYEKFFQYLVRQAIKKGLIEGKIVAVDSSFVGTYTAKKEEGSSDWNGFKKGYGFKLHALIDAITGFPLAIVCTDGLFYDGYVAIPLLKKAKRYLKQLGYVVADKGYDYEELVAWIVQKMNAKAGIPLRKKSTVAKGKPYRYGNLLNWRLKAAGRTFKHSIYKHRTEIERFFAQLKGRFHLGKEKTRGIGAFIRNAYLSLISYCLAKFYAIGTVSF